MNDPNEKISVPKIYNITALTAFVYAGLLIIYSVYFQFFYVDGTWTHGFISNGFFILSNLILIGILFNFKGFLNKILNYKKTNSTINFYLILLAIIILLLLPILIKSIQIYKSLSQTETTGMLGFASTSILSALLILLCNLTMIVVGLLLGNHIRKIDIVEKKLFTILGVSFIIYEVCALLNMISSIVNDMILLILKAVIVTVIGLILKKVYSMNSSDLSSLIKPETNTNVYLPKENIQSQVLYYEQPKEVIKTNNDKKITKKENDLDNKIPQINLDELENNEVILSYFKNLPKTELNRLDFIVSKKYNQNLTEEQKTNLIIHYIVENKLYDHQRYIPK